MKKYIVLALSIATVSSVFSRENVGQKLVVKQQSLIKAAASSCNPAYAQTDLDLNNVRTTILAGGDMWWGLSSTVGSRYEVPKNGGKHSLFAGALWIGGIDQGGQLKIAAQTYRQNGNDFWSGPLDVTTASTNLDLCDKYDKHFKITRQEVEDFNGWMNNKSDPAYEGYTVPKSITDWPGNGDASQNEPHFLAPFFDKMGDGEYNPEEGDYPDYNLTGKEDCSSRLFGDQTLWWVFNDKGDIHSESKSQPIGLEVRAQAFAFSTNDEINNMTFYNYEIINRSTFQLNKTYFGQWVDADLGYAYDDFVGCDVGRGLGYCYNGKAIDGTGGPAHYGENPPAIGVDFFQGPLADLGDGKDNDKDGITDEIGEQIIMSKFVYYNNDFTKTGNPEIATHFYNYLSGFWKDGVPFTYGKDAYATGGPVCDFMFPGNTDPTGSGTGGAPQPAWDEPSAGNTPADRRFIQSAGPFTLYPGAVNHITVGAVWARANQGGPEASVALMRLTDDKAQALFDNCFRVLNGPDAPDLTIQELNNELIIFITNKPTSNNYLEKYQEKDPLIVDLTDANGVKITNYDKYYKFEGYQIYQLKDATVTQVDLNNPSKARLVSQMDVKNGITQLVNFDFDQALGASVPTEMVNGKDLGINHSLKVTEDQFALGADKRLVNFKQYYFMAISYAQNRFKVYNQNDPNFLDGQKKPYKAGRKNIKIWSGIPHDPAPEAFGTEIHGTYNFGPKITRIEGNGNGGMVLDLTQKSIDDILASSDNRILHPQYENGYGPVNIRVVDPLNVPDAEFDLRLNVTKHTLSGINSKSHWTLTNKLTGEVVKSDTTLEVNNEQLILKWGLAVNVKQVAMPGAVESIENGNLKVADQYQMVFADENKKWLTGFADQDGSTNFNWIRSGDYPTSPFADLTTDVKQDYEKILGGTWAPYALCAFSDKDKICIAGPAWEKKSTVPKLAYLASVDVVITPDKTKWSRCPVFELGEEAALTEGGAEKMDLRRAQSVDKYGKKASVGSGASTNPDDANYISETGMGWFPGYAINVETGERLNIAFGEDSWLVADNGRDMLWNPTSKVASSPSGNPVLGGKHYIYVFGHNADGTNDIPRYDKGEKIVTKLLNKIPSEDFLKQNVFEDAMWVNIPLLVEGRNLLETEVKVKLRVATPYKKGYTGLWGTKSFFQAVPDNVIDTALASVNNNYPLYRFSTADIATHTDDSEVAKSVLEKINIVPNPYYAYSQYEKTQIDNRVKITNLPEKCTVKIYTLNGTLIRTFDKDERATFIDWDLKNQASIPVASGLYIVHVDVKGVGERIFKWFGVMRPIDLDSF